MAGYPLRINVIRYRQLFDPEKGGKYGRVRGTRHHHGWDLSAPPGSAVYAVGPGKITAVITDREVPGYGHIIQQEFIANGSNRYWALYAHLSKASCEVGAFVAQGQLIGFTGMSGNAKGQPPHLHFEVATSASLKKGRSNRIDPAHVLGSFLDEHPAGSASVIESGYEINLDHVDIEKVIREGQILSTIA